MAQSPTHKFGQIIGDLLEESVGPSLEAIAKTHGVFLDHKHARPARQGRKNVSWIDAEGNAHDLDYVMEEGGTKESQGKPRAFIETAWRRYTKHSRNKVQEIQGAVLALAQTYADCQPFLGVILAGVFTEASLAQLRTNGFQVVYFPYKTIIKAFARVGIDARFDESTPDEVVQQKVDAFDQLDARKRGTIRKALLKDVLPEFDLFLVALAGALARTIEDVYVRVLHGKTEVLKTAAAAIAFLQDYAERDASLPFARYEVGVRYSNGNDVKGTFGDKASAIAFLKKLT